MKRDLRMRPIDLSSSFISVEKDMEIIIRKLFMESQPYSSILKRLLVINTPDCVDNTTNEDYHKVDSMSVAELKQQGYIKFQPRIDMEQHEQKKSYLIVTMDDFSPNARNPKFRDCTVLFHILCHNDCWDLGNFRIRPLKIAGYIDGILENSRLAGIGTFNLVGAGQVTLDETLSGYTLIYRAVHWTDDKLIIGDKDKVLNVNEAN